MMMLAAPVAVTLRRLQWGEIIIEGAFKIVVVMSGMFSKHNRCSTLSVRFRLHLKPPVWLISIQSMSCILSMTLD